MDQHLLVILFAANAVDAGHARHHDHIAPREQGTHRRKPQPLDLLVDARILLDEGVRARQVRLGLVIIEVTDEKLDGVAREKAPKLRVKLRGQGLVVGDHQHGAIQLLDHVGDGERFAGAGHPEQRLVPGPGAQTLQQLGDRLRLIALRHIGRFKFEEAHSSHRGRPEPLAYLRRIFRSKALTWFWSWRARVSDLS